MARNALLIWCAGSALACGTAALATTTLWREPVAPVPLAVTAGELLAALPMVEEPEPPAGLDVEAPRLLLATISFFSPSAPGASNMFRGALDPASPIEAASPGAPEAPEAAFTEVSPQDEAADHRLAVRPPPRPNFQLAAIDPGAKAALGEVPGGAAPGFESANPIPQTPSWNWFETPRAAAPRDDRVLNAGVASWYGPGFHGRKTASGERFDQNDMTAAHRTLPFGTRVKVVDERTGRSIVVRINDRGPFKHGRVIDLSKAAAQALGVGGLSRVKVVSAN